MAIGDLNSGTRQPATPESRRLDGEVQANLRKARTALRPPKAKELERQASTCCARAALGTKSRSQAGSGLRVVHRGRDDAVGQGEGGGGSFDGSGGAQGVGVHGLGGADGELVRVGAEDEADGGGFGAVVDLGRGAVGVDVADLLRGEAGIAQGHAHGAGGALGGGLGDVAGIGGHAEADDLRDGPGAAGERGLQRLQHQHGGAFAQHQAAAVGGEGAAGVLADDAHGLPGLEIAEVERSLAAAGDGHGGDAGTHHLEGLADGVRGGGAGGGDGVGRALNAELHGDVAGAGVGSCPAEW